MLQKLLILLFNFFSFSGLAQGEIYTPKGNLTPEFVEQLCDAARNKYGEGELGPSKLESLISKAAGTYYKDSLQPKRSLTWHRKYAAQCRCSSTENFGGGDILRQIVQSNFREFANIVGPNNRLSLDLSYKDPEDSLTIREWVNAQRVALEAKYDDKRFEFQQDEDWRNIMFFYFIFSEYSIN